MNHSSGRVLYCQPDVVSSVRMPVVVSRIVPAWLRFNPIRISVDGAGPGFESRQNRLLKSDPRKTGQGHGSRQLDGSTGLLLRAIIPPSRDVSSDVRREDK